MAPRLAQNASGAPAGNMKATKARCVRSIFSGLGWAHLGALPELAGTDDLAVITAARRIVAVVPRMSAADAFAVFALGRDAEIDQKPRQSFADPCPPAIRMLRIPVGHLTHLSPENQASRGAHGHHTPTSPLADRQDPSGRVLPSLARVSRR
jgi:hypothetical protein